MKANLTIPSGGQVDNQEKWNVQPVGSENKVSLKKQMVDLLDKYLLGYISSAELIKATVPMLMLSGNKRGRKNYIEKYLMDISSKAENDISRKYIYQIRETIIGEGNIPEKDRKKILRRTIKKLIERLIFEEIDPEYFLSGVYDIMLDFHEEIEQESVIRSFMDSVRLLSEDLQKIREEKKSQNEFSPILDLVTDFYDTNYKGLWDE